jgi:hypothetical protein
LLQVEAFPEEYRAAVRAVAAALAARGRDPGEYTAEVAPAADGLLEVHARHDSHPAGGSWRGDPCGRCRVARYDPRADTVVRVLGIR